MQSPLPFHAKISAHIKGLLLAPERVTLILGSFFLIVFISSLICLTHKPTIWAIVGAIIGLCGLVSLLMRWLIWGFSYQAEPSGIAMIASKEEFYISTSSSFEAEKFIPILREFVQNRQTLPPPHGAVKSGKPQKTEELSVYTPEKRNKILRAIKEGIAQHDQDFVKQLKEVEKELPKLLAQEKIELPVQTEIKAEGEENA